MISFESSHFYDAMCTAYDDLTAGVPLTFEEAHLAVYEAAAACGLRVMAAGTVGWNGSTWVVAGAGRNKLAVGP